MNSSNCYLSPWYESCGGRGLVCGARVNTAAVDRTYPSRYGTVVWNGNGLSARVQVILGLGFRVRV